MIDRSQPIRFAHQLARASQIATILWSSGFRWLVAALELRSCVSAGCRVMCSTGLRQCSHHVDMDQPLPERMREALERLGPTFVKVGQMVAVRPDYIPLEYAQALSKLHDHVDPFPGEQARDTVERELGRPLTEVFSDFETDPFAAASLSQVHRATLPDGRPVAVKVQRPGIEEQMARDLELLAFLAQRLERRRPETLGFRPTAAVAELAEYTARELDFRQEARTAQRVRVAFEHDDRIVVPWVDGERTTSRVLTMQLMEGHAPAPADELRAAGFDVDALLRIGAEAMVRQIFELGLFHADPHPGNVLFLAGDRVCFLDFGMFGRLSTRDRRRVGFMLWSLIEGDYETVGEQLLRLAKLAPGARPDRFRDALEVVVEDWHGAADGGGSIAHLLLAELALGARNGVIFPRELMLVSRALVGIDATTALIAPDITFRELIQPLLPTVRHALMPSGEQLQDALYHRRFDYLQLVLDLPDLVPDVVLGLGERTSAPASPPSPGPSSAALLGAGMLVGALAAASRRMRRPGR